MIKKESFNATELSSKYKTISFASAWASANSKAFKVLMKNKNKINKIVVGIHFYQTNPNFIEEFINNDKVKFITNPSGIFHPKMYIFSNDDNNWEALIGSANFTKAAFEKNTETMICISNKDINAELTYHKLIQEIESYHQRAQIFTKDDLTSYKQIWNKKLKTRDDLQDKFAKNDSDDVKPIYKSKIITSSWNNYVNEVKKDNLFETRLKLLEKAKNYFEKTNSFEEMNQEVRLKIAGSTRWDNGLDWHLFGHTVIHPRTVVSIKERISNFSKALEYIPLTGDVDKKDYMSFLNAFEDKDKSLGYGVSVVSRILAMKRRDVFICLTRANRENIKNDFGINKENLLHFREIDYT